MARKMVEATHSRSDLFDHRDRTVTEVRNSAKASMSRSHVLPLVTHTHRTGLPS